MLKSIATDAECRAKYVMDLPNAVNITAEPCVVYGYWTDLTIQAMIDKAERLGGPIDRI